MAKKGEARTWDDEQFYDVKLLRPTEWPKGSSEMLSPGMKITMKGRSAKQIEEDIADAKPVIN